MRRSIELPIPETASERIAAAKPTAEFESKVQEAAKTCERFVGQVYADLKDAK